MYGEYKQYFELSTTALIAAYQIYGAAVDIAVAPATTYQTAAPYNSPIAVVAQGRAPAAGDMGATPIYGISCHWCIRGTTAMNPHHNQGQSTIMTNAS